MKTIVDNYRGWEITFDTDTEKFTAYSNGYDRDMVKVSYASCKSSIDEFIKENSEFRPFYIFPNIDGYDRKGKCKVIGIRKDGAFMIEDSKGVKSQMSKYNEDGYILYTDGCEILISKYNELRKKLQDDMESAKKDLIEKLKPVTIKEYREQLKTS